jgi:beta-mannosidase
VFPVQITDLTADWTLRALGGPIPDSLIDAAIPAEVPGSTHTDLMRAGLIPDPYLDATEAALTWTYDVDWRYTTDLSAAPATDGERVDLVFDGLDTVATISLGDTELGRTFNMHRSYRFDVSGLVSGSPQRLTVDFRSATAYADEECARLGDRPKAYGPPFNFIRKMACSFGWDWGPDLRTAGVWKGVRLERWRVARLARVRPLVSVDAEGTGHVELHVDLERVEPDAPLTLAGVVLGQEARVEVPGGESSAVLALSVPDAPLWWPAGYGGQPLHDLALRLLADGEELDRWERRIGFRTVELDTAEDEHGTAFTFRINGRPIFAKGANWIPDDHFLTRITRGRLERRLDQAVSANLNLLRVWGGGIYETEDFYSACDERGLLVWQDFLLACAAYPEESPLWEELEAEARENVVRLMPHPALIHFNGGNENLWGHADWHWQDRLGDLTWGERYARELFRDVVAELDPTRTYSDNSPYSPGGRRHPNDPDHGTHHQWEVWNVLDYSLYRSEIPRFCSEFGFQGPPAWRTLEDWVHSAEGGPLAEASDPKNDPNFLIHQKAADGNGKLDRGLAPHLGVPADFDDWHWATQLNQARAVTYAVDHYRSWWPRTAGAIVWQLNDCWPVTSWAAVDSEERPKPLWYALRHAFAPRRLSLVQRDGRPALAVVNDTDEPWSGNVDLGRQRFDGTELARAESLVEVAARGVAVVPLGDVAAPDDPSAEVLAARLDDVRVLVPFAEDVDLALDPDPLTVTATAVDGGYRVDVTALSYARDVTLLPDRLAADAVVDDALVDLMAGESASFLVWTAVAGLERGLTRALRSANDLRATADRRQ